MAIPPVEDRCPACAAQIPADRADCPRCGQRRTDPLPGSPPAATQDRPAAGEFAAGAILEHKYELVERLGAGGFGTVWKARHLLLDKVCAVKLLGAEHSADPRFRETFIREGRIVTSLTHPHIVQATDLGLTGDGRLFIVMELAAGEPLSAILKREGKLPIPLVVQLATQILSGVEHAHAHKVVHRDLKPDNVMVSGWGTRDVRAKVVDFGIAKILTSGVSGGVTMRGFGTRPYASPEQEAGLDVDHRADVYAVGVILYEMLSGLGRMDLFARMVKEPPEAIGRARPELSADLEAVVRRALVKDPRKRTQSASLLRTELSAALARAQAPRPARDNSWVSSLPGCLALLALLYVASYLRTHVDWSVWPPAFGHQLRTDTSPIFAGIVFREPTRDHYATGEVVKLTATSWGLYHFVGWSDGVTDSTRDYVMPDHEVMLTARFEAIKFDPRLLGMVNLTVAASPALGGTVSVAPALSRIVPGTRVELTATPAPGWRVAFWPPPDTQEILNLQDFAGTTRKAFFIMPAKDVAVTVTFAPVLGK